MNIILLHAGFGLLGGLVRGIVGAYKAYTRTHQHFSKTYFFTTLIISALIGAFVAFALTIDYRISLLAGYAGIDLLDNLHKVLQRKP